jgi:hypothetical protein
MKKILSAMGLACLFAAASLAQYSQQITTATSSLTITQAQHGYSSTKLGVMLYDGNGLALPTTGYSYTIDSSTYAVNITFSPTISSGTVKILGVFATATTASTDFQVTAATSTVTVCASCSSSSPAARTTNGTGYVSRAPVTFTASFPGVHPNFTARAYILDNVMVLGISVANTSVGFTCAWGSDGGAAGSCRIDYSISSFPTGAVPLGDVYYSGTTFGSVTDDRPASFQ